VIEFYSHKKATTATRKERKQWKKIIVALDQLKVAPTL